MPTSTPAPEFRLFDHTDADGDTVSFRIRKPSRRELEAADFEFSGTFNRALIAELPPNAVMLRRLEKLNLWSEESELELERLRKTAIAASDAMKEGKAKGFASPEAEAASKDALRVANVAFSEKRSEIDSMLGHTADAKADEAHRRFLIACTTERFDPATGKAAGRVWESVSDYVDEEDQVLVARAIYEYTTFNAGIESEWNDSNPADSGAEGEKADDDAPAEPATSAPQPVVAPAAESPAETPVEAATAEADTTA